MKKQNNVRIFTVIAVLALAAGISLSAYTGTRSKHNGRKAVTQNSSLNDGRIQFKTSLSNRYYYGDNQVYLYIDLKAGKNESAGERSPMNVAVVIDRSGSMGDKNKLTYVKRSVDHIIDKLNKEDYISIVDYDDVVDVLQRSAKINDKYDLRQKISRLEPGGYTNLSEGMFEGYFQVNKSYSRGYVNRVFLLSDGLANRGITDRYRLADMVREKNKKDGITISTFGVGNDFNENLMADIADYGKGNYYYIRDAEQIPEIFAQELQGVRYLAGHSTRVSVRFPAGCLRLNNVYGYPYDVSGNEVIIDFKDIFSGDNKSVLLKFDIISPCDRKLEFESELSYEDINSDFKIINEKQNIFAERTDDLAEYEKSFDVSVRQSVAMFEANAIMEEALREADKGNYTEARTKLENGKKYLDEQKNTSGTSPAMEQQSATMDNYNDKLKDAESKSEEEKKEMQKEGKYDNYNSRKRNQ